MTQDTEYLKNKLNDLKSKVPVLILDKACDIFKRLYTDIIYDINDVDILAKLDKVTKHIVVIDISNIRDFKVLEKIISNYNVILLAYKHIPQSILFKVNFIIKFKNNTNNQLYSTIEAINKLKALEDVNLDDFYAEDSPSLKYDSILSKKSSSQSKVLPLIGVIS